MDIRSIVPRLSNFEIDKKFLFINKEELEYNGLIFTNNSLIFSDLNKIYVNLIPTNEIFNLVQQNYTNRQFKLELDIDNSCPHGSGLIKAGSYALWHKTHFDEWKGRFTDAERLLNSYEELEYKNIYFSSVFYQYNLKSGLLCNFINTRPFELMLNEFTFELPALLEISISDDSASALIFPINNKMEYSGIIFYGVITLKNNGDFVGACYEPVKGMILNAAEPAEIEVPAGTTLTLMGNDTFRCIIYNLDLQRAETIFLRKIKTF